MGNEPSHISRAKNEAPPPRPAAPPPFSGDTSPQRKIITVLLLVVLSLWCAVGLLLLSGRLRLAHQRVHVPCVVLGRLHLRGVPLVRLVHELLNPQVALLLVAPEPILHDRRDLSLVHVGDLLAVWGRRQPRLEAGAAADRTIKKSGIVF